MKRFIALIVFLAACSDPPTQPDPNTNTPPPTTDSISLAPSDWTLPSGATVRFRAYNKTTSRLTATWSVNDIVGGNAEVGTITPDGTYTAPGSSRTVVIRAKTSTNAIAVGTVAVKDLGPASIGWFVTAPRVIDTTTDSVAVFVHVNGFSAAMTLTDVNGGNSIVFEPWSTQEFRAMVPRSRALLGYTEGDYHNVLGKLTVDGVPGTYNVTLNVNDATMPSYPVTALAADAQRTDYVLNLRYDGTDYRTKTELLPKLYQYRPDNFDFVTIVDAVSTPNNRYFSGVRNSIVGTGVTTFDNGAATGSTARLKGVVVYPITQFFDGASNAYSHELGHSWISFTKGVFGGGAHWPPSDLARDIMGFNIPGSGAGGTFTMDAEQQPDGTWRITCAGATQTFNDFSLYLMGLVPASETTTHRIITNWSLSTRCGDVANVTQVTVNDVIALNGARNPAYPNTPRSFNVGTIVLSRGGLLTPAELSFFSHMAARAELKSSVMVAEGLARFGSSPFYVATGGRASLVTKMW